MSVEIEIPKYQSYIKVGALKIKDIKLLSASKPDKNGAEDIPVVTIYPENDTYRAFDVPYEYYSKHNPKAGGYYIVYPDGYISFSPENVFEDRYVLLSNVKSLDITDDFIEYSGYANCGDASNHRFKSSDQIEPWIEGAKWARDKFKPTPVKEIPDDIIDKMYRQDCKEMKGDLSFATGYRMAVLRFTEWYRSQLNK